MTECTDNLNIYIYIYIYIYICWQHTPAKNKKLCDPFSDFFTNKIKKLKITMNSKLNTLIHPPFADPLHIGSILESLPNVEPHEVVHLLKSMPAKSSPTDYIPTSLLLSWTNVFSKIISHLANLSFCHACFTSSFKVARLLLTSSNLVPTKVIHLITDQFLTSIPYQRY